MRERSEKYSGNRKASTIKQQAIQTDQVASANALRRLLSAAAHQTAQSKIVARFLLALHDSERFQFKLMDLRVLEKELFKDCMAVLGLTHETLQPLRALNNNGQPIWEKLAATCNLDSSGNPLPNTITPLSINGPANE